MAKLLFRITNNIKIKEPEYQSLSSTGVKHRCLVCKDPVRKVGIIFKSSQFYAYKWMHINCLSKFLDLEGTQYKFQIIDGCIWCHNKMSSSELYSYHGLVIHNKCRKRMMDSITAVCKKHESEITARCI